MSLVINTNSTATQSRNYLATNQTNLQRSLGRLASGSRIVRPSDDAGGLAVGNKLSATVNRNVRAQQNVSNAISFLQVQDGALSAVGKILDRMSELKTMSLDVTKNSDDIANYDAEFGQLQDQLGNIKQQKFNGISLFTEAAAAAGAGVIVYTTEAGDTQAAVGPPVVDAGPTVELTTHLMFETGTAGSGVTATTGGDLLDKTVVGAGTRLEDFNTSDFVELIQNGATARATNGAEMSRLEHSLGLLVTNQANLEAARSRLLDVDVATESTHFAKHNILVQSSAAMLAQANSVPNVALQLLG